MRRCVAMYEAFAVNLPRTTGIVQWMLNASWPKLYWQLYDYYLLPGGAYFGAKKGAAPWSIVYNYGDRGVYLANQTERPLGDLRTTVTAYDLNSERILEQRATNACPIFGSKKILDLSSLASKTPVFFLNLAAQSLAAPGFSVDNFYWLSTKPDVLDEDKSEWFFTPNKSFADFTALTNLPKAAVRAALACAPAAQGVDASVTLTNQGERLAFFIEARLVSPKSGRTLLPVFWDDNYVSLPPHAQKTLQAHLPTVPAGVKPELRLEGWNMERL